MARASEVYEKLIYSKANLRSKIVLEEDPNLESLRECKTTLSSYTQNSERVKTVCDGTSLLYFSEPYSPDWHAKVNGNETKIYKANARFMAVLIPGGESEVELYYFPRSLETGAAVSAVSTVVLAILFVKTKKRK